MPSYLREDPHEAAVALARRLMELSGLDRERAQQLAVLARALSKSEQVWVCVADVVRQVSQT